MISGFAFSTGAARSQIIGYEPFDYPSTIVGTSGGVFWDYKNTFPAGHTSRPSAWREAPGLAERAVVSGGRLLTGNSGIIRDYGGPPGADVEAGAVNNDTVAKAVYYRITMTRSAESEWCGLSSFDFGAERLFFGVFPGTGNKFSIYNQTTFTPLVTSTVTCNAGQPYTLVAKIDYANDLVKLMVDPDLDAPEPVLPLSIFMPTPIVAQAAYTGTNWSTGLRIASGPSSGSELFSGLVVWDDLTVATTWESLRSHAVTNSETTGPGSLRQAVLQAGVSGGRVTFPHTGAVYATTGTRLIRFNRNQPDVLTLDVPITGLAAGETIVGMDFRKGDGNGLYAMGFTSPPGASGGVGRLYQITPSTGAATLVGGGPFSITLPGFSDYGFDFQTVIVPREGEFSTIRIICASSLNLRLNPDTGALIARDQNLSGALSNAAASDVVRKGNLSSSLYAIDPSSPARLWRIGGPDGEPPADNGVATLIGVLDGAVKTGIRLSFDIADDGSAWLTAGRTTGGPSYLHTIDLKTAATREIGRIGNFTEPLAGLCVAPSEIQALGLDSGPRDTILDGGSHGGKVRIGFSENLGLLVNPGEALALRQLQVESSSGIAQNGGVLTASGCTFLRCGPSAITCTAGELSLDRCTFVENDASAGGALWLSNNRGFANARITHCTFAGNRAFGGNPAESGGGAIYNRSGILQLTACIVAGNTSASGTGPDIWSSGITTAEDCLIGDDRGSGITETAANGNKTGDTADPVAHNLAPLADYGGGTLSMPPLPLSNAINQARAASWSGDQRGFPMSGLPDAGAAEYQGKADLSRYWNTDWDGDGSPYGMEQAVDTYWDEPDNSSLKNLRITYTSGAPSLTFFLNPTARPHTRWVVKRFLDLQSPGEEIYRFDGPTSTNTIAPGIFQGTSGSLIVVRDQPPNPARAFYRLEAVLVP